ncbi:unnamed protein product [Rotaria sordida]|uniref:Uncharacterized protein n=1 Tax=Rotaria sordida TaxID=392033 RepID=A0A814SM38_9BILA|nr:unnamed protein product [Rotaria sordida]CAF1150201.1 unnamed protein product [Rotaria sordida]
MATRLFDKVLNCSPNLCRHDSRPSSRELNLLDLSSDALVAWDTDHSADLNYYVELAHRIASTFDDADQLILFDDISIVISDTQRPMILGMRGFDRSLLPGLWLSTGFRRSGRILVYAPPNTIEMSTYLTLKKLIEQHLQRKVPIEILYEDSADQLHEIIDGARRSFVFSYEITEYHHRELQPFTDRLLLPDLPTNQERRIAYLREYIEAEVVGESLPIFAVVEKFIEPQKRSGNIDADYTVCGFVLNGKFFPT